MKTKILISLLVTVLLFAGFGAQPTHAADDPRITIYVVPTITDEKILPTTIIPDSRISSEISITASRGEYEAASFVIKALEDINIAAKRYLLIQSSNPVGLIQSIRETHETLVVYVNSDKKQADLANFVSSLELFTNRVREISIAVQQLREIRDSRL